MNIHSEVCLLDYGGGCEIPPGRLKECWKIAKASVEELCRMLEQTLVEADERAQKERLERLQQQHNGNSEVSVPLPPINTPYFEHTHDTNEMELQVDVNSNDMAAAQTKAEEAYRQQALDYSKGHVASKVSENKSAHRVSAHEQAASLFASMLRSSKMEVADANAKPTLPPSAKTQNDTALTTTAVSTVTLDKAAEGDQNANERSLPAMDLDDEEEATAVLHSEFEQSPAVFSEKTAKEDKIEILAITGCQEDEMVDLSMAVKKKKKKSKKKK